MTSKEGKKKLFDMLINHWDQLPVFDDEPHFFLDVLFTIFDYDTSENFIPFPQLDLVRDGVVDILEGQDDE